jgi:hypothetical protein
MANIAETVITHVLQLEPKTWPGGTADFQPRKTIRSPSKTMTKPGYGLVTTDHNRPNMVNTTQNMRRPDPLQATTYIGTMQGSIKGSTFKGPQQGKSPGKPLQGPPTGLLQGTPSK